MPKTVTRRNFTERLGLPANASDAQVLAAADAQLGRRKASPTPLFAQRAAEDALYELAFGAEEGRTATTSGAEATAVQLADDALYELAFGGDA
ncbi:hypothetical protein [Microbacterium sp. CPCC 204701]|uniref:hypothetical protein n=1 Tax=Microbacterium sp. CPCC 204701 TaxID=2493084 RepID=UPI000FD9CF4A|nr:hypothetical protein [Microbacterium sp. CPCC 204701]